MSSAGITVVICTHNREQLLARSMAALNAARRPTAAAKLLVVANACSDGTHAYLESYGQCAEQTLPMRWLAEPRPGKSHALNLALGVVDTELIAFVDDDQRVDEDFLAVACAAAERLPDADILMGRIEPDWTGAEPAWIREAGPYRIYPFPVPQIGFGDQEFWSDAQTAIPSGGNAVVRHRVWSQVGDFSTTLGPTGHNLGGGEDTEWFMRAIRAGAKVRYVPNLLQFHHVDPARLTLAFMMRFAFERTAAGVSVETGADHAGRAPAWAYRKLMRYVASALLSASMARRRFFLVRSAASLGEIAGYRRRDAARNLV